MTSTEALIAALVRAHDTGTRIVPAMADLSRADCLRIQSAVMARLGKVAGFKVGQTTDGQRPILAPIPQRYVVAHGGTRRVPDRLGVELEVGFELVKPLPGNTLPDDPGAFFRPLVALELVDTRLEGPSASEASLKFADFQINAGLVAGGRAAGWAGSDFTVVEAALSANGQTVMAGAATVPGGSALANLAALIENLGNHCGGLQPGQIVITGSLCGLPYFGPGTTIRGEISGLGTVAVNLG